MTDQPDQQVNELIRTNISSHARGRLEARRQDRRRELGRFVSIPEIIDYVLDRLDELEMEEE